MIYIGNNDNAGYILNKIDASCRQVRVPDKALLKDYTGELISFADTVYIFDITSFADPEDGICKEIDRVCRATNADIIIYAPGLAPSARILTSLSALGYKKIITDDINLSIIELEIRTFLADEKVIPQLDDNVVEARDADTEEIYTKMPELKRIVDEDDEFAFLNEITFSSDIDTVDVQEESIPATGNIIIDNKERSKERPERPVKKVTRQLKIGVIGAMRRIGTTTAALQFIKYLNDIEEHSAAYLQYNNTGFIELLDDYYYTDKTPELGKIVFENIDMYMDPKRIKKIESQGYKYIIYDHGDYKAADKVSVMEKDIIIIVGGCEPDEIKYMTFAMDYFKDQKNVFYILNFTPETDEDEILDRQADVAIKTYFMAYTPNRYVYNPANGHIFRDILASDYDLVEETTGKEKRVRRLLKR